MEADEKLFDDVLEREKNRRRRRRRRATKGRMKKPIEGGPEREEDGYALKALATWA